MMKIFIKKMLNNILNILLSDNGEKSVSIFASLLTFFGLDKFLFIGLNETISQEIMTGFIKMVFSVITAIIVYYILEFIKKRRNENKTKRR